MERKKLELEVNKKISLVLLFDSPISGESQYGKYYMYGVENGNEEFNFFAPLKVHEALKDKSRGTKFQLTKTAQQKGKKLVQDFEIKFLDNGKDEKKSKPKPDETEYYSAMLKSYEEAAKIQSKYSAVNLNQCAVTLYISRVKSNGFNNYPKE